MDSMRELSESARVVEAVEVISDSFAVGDRRDIGTGVRHTIKMRFTNLNFVLFGASRLEGGEHRTPSL
jgi:hypothetical protein